MKKIAIVLHGASVGGIETALVNMLNIIDLKKYSVVFISNFKGNPCIGKLPPEIKCVDLEQFEFKKVLFDRIKKFRLLSAMRMIFFYLRSKITKSYSKKAELISKSFFISDEVYDCAIAYKQDYGTLCTALFQIKSSKKIMWLHGPIWHEQNPDDHYIKWMSSFDKVFGVSQDVVDRLNAAFPEGKSKSEVFLNIMDKNEIIRKSQLCTDEVKKELGEGSEIKLISVGRFCEAKNLENVPFMCRRIIESGIEVKWFLIGYGELENEIKENIKKTNTENNVIILGQKENPFPYISNCDVYIQPSRIEGRSISVVEAQILAKPVIITEYPTARAQLRDGYDGIIVPMETMRCAEKIAEILKNKQILQELAENTKKMDYCSHSEINKLYAVLED